MSIHSIRLLLVTALAPWLFTNASFAQTTTRGEAACATLQQVQIPGAALSDVKTVWSAAGAPLPVRPPESPSGVTLPAFCRLDATLDRRIGAKDTVYGIGFALALPAEWNGRLLFQGGGGLNGSVAPPLGRTSEGDPALARGFAVVTTDTGHKGEVFDASFMADQQASLDFAYQAVGRVAVLARQIVAQYYGTPAAHAYFMGCSTGGREGMLMVQRYPTYFDGVIVGAPAMRTHLSGIGDEWVATMLNRAAPANPVGRPFSATEMDVDARVDAASASPSAQLTATSSWINLNTFSAHGGKLLFYHGVSDPWFSALDTVDYYERMTQANGGREVVTSWSRLFLAPGMGHCGGGPAALDSFDMLSAIVDWVERKQAPESIRATGRAWPGRTRLLCPYPSHAQYKGSGDPEDSRSFECRASP
jgi:hypothetical protein